MSFILRGPRAGLLLYHFFFFFSLQYSKGCPWSWVSQILRTAVANQSDPKTWKMLFLTVHILPFDIVRLAAFLGETNSFQYLRMEKSKLGLHVFLREKKNKKQRLEITSCPNKHKLFQCSQGFPENQFQSGIQHTVWSILPAPAKHAIKIMYSLSSLVCQQPNMQLLNTFSVSL